MRLLNIHTFTFKEFPVDEAPPYVAASHRWTDDETCYKDVRKGKHTGTRGYQKVQRFCEAVRNTNAAAQGAARVFGKEQSCDWLWIDTACIDKTNSVELSESINSMFQYYANADRCYAFLQDVGTEADQRDTESIFQFVKSEWFARGWTLQELIAPGRVVFFSKQWKMLGHKCPWLECGIPIYHCDRYGPRLNSTIRIITKIPQDALTNRQSIRLALSVFTGDDKMKWAEGRITTRPEDRAYCLLGLLDVHLPLIYGEGDGAWARLKEAVQKKVDSDDWKPAKKSWDKIWAQSATPGCHRATRNEVDMLTTLSYPCFDRKRVLHCAVEFDGDGDVEEQGYRSVQATQDR